LSRGRALALAALVLAAAGCEGRSRSGAAPASSASAAPKAGPALDGSGPALAELDLGRGLPEHVASSLFSAQGKHTMLDLVRLVPRLRDDDATKGLLVRLGAGPMSLARAAEAGRLFGEVRAKGKPVFCHAHDYANGTMLLASLGCSKIWVSPAGGVDTVGVAAQLVFAAKLLDKLHVGVDFLQVGKYKGASEPFTRDAPSPEARASLEGALRGVRVAWLEGLAKGRSEAAAEAVEDGPFTPTEAKTRGLVDAIGTPEEARDAAKKAASVDRVVTRFGAVDAGPSASGGVIDVLRSLSGASHVGVPHVAVVRAIGGISMGGAPSGLPFGGSEGITERDLGRVITRLTTESATKAVVLRIDSPGGSALASDLLWKKLVALREKKPLVVSIGGMAASGGYYLACAANKVLAEPESIVGSIGVVGGKLTFGDALEQLGVHVETVAAAPDPKKAARATYMSPFSPWDAPTRERVLASMTSVYDLFLSRVAEGRGVTVDKVASSAEGQVFGGVDAKARSLVDELGGFGDAIRVARELAKLPDDAPLQVVGDQAPLFDLFDGDPDDDESERARAAVAAEAQRAAREVVGEPWRALLPEVLTFIGSVRPVVEGERTLVALPFVLSVR
jgi:protease-4